MSKKDKKNESTALTLLTALIFIIAIITVIVTYESKVPDPIENTKKLLINTYLLLLLALIIILLLIRFFSPNDTILLRNLKIVFAISMIVMLVFFGLKIKLDLQYGDGNEFKKFYVGENTTNEDIADRFSISLDGIALITDEEFYLEECKKMFTLFKIKFNIIMGLHLIITMIILYKILKMQMYNTKQKRIKKDDKIVFHK